MSLTSVFTAFSSFRSSQGHYADAGLKNLNHKATNTSEQSDVVTLGDNKAPTETYRAGPVVAPSIEGEGERTAAANNILNFIAGRLRVDFAEGALKEDLESRLEAGLSGFLKGYQEAYTQLAGTGFLEAEVEQAIEKTFTDVLDGIESLAQELEIENPITDELSAQQNARRENYTPPESVVDEGVSYAVSTPLELVSTLSESLNINANVEAQNLKNLIEATTFNYRESETRNFNFSLKTQDGDTVTIKAAFASVSLFDGESVRYGESTETSASGSFRAASGFYLDVKGELDDNELLAIEDLLKQVREVSDLFFSGDIESAFNYATELGFNSEEIAQFSLNLRYQRVTRVEETYQQVANQNNATDPVSPKVDALNTKDERLLLIARFVQILEDTRIKAQALGIEITRPNDEDKASKPVGPEGIVQSLLARLDKIAEA